MRPSWLAAIVLLSFACAPPSDEPPDMDTPDLVEVVRPPRDASVADTRPLDMGPPLDGMGPSPDGDAVLVPDVGGLTPGLPRLQVTMVDVGQGDGLVVQLPGGKVIAIDGGPSRTAYLGTLTDLGIKRIDYAVLSHAHSDHYTGLTPALTTLMPTDCVTRVFDPGLDRSDIAGYTEFKTAAGCRYQKVGIGQSLNLDPAVDVSVLSAHDMRFGATDDSHGVNNTSVVVRLRYRNFSMLFEGDAETPAEQATAMAFPTLLRSTVLKAGHHGSCTASGTSYLNLVSPQYMLMSLADGNSYGMPHCQTMAKLKLRPRLQWARTDVNGNISVTSDGLKFAVTLGKGASSVDTCPRDCASPMDF